MLCPFSNRRFVPEPDLRCRLSRDHKQRSARRTLQRPLSCLAPQAPAFSLDGFRGIADMIVGPPATQPPEWLVAFWPIAFFERMLVKDIS